MFILWLAKAPLDELREEVYDLRETLGYAQDRFIRAEKNVVFCADTALAMFKRAQFAEAEVRSLERELRNTQKMLDEYTPDHVEMEKRRRMQKELKELLNGPSAEVNTGWETDPVV